MSNKQHLIRIRAVKRMMWSGVPVFILVWLFLSLNKPVYYRAIMTGLAAGCVPFIADFIQLVSGISFTELTDKWRMIKREQRIAIALAAIGAFIILIFLIVIVVTSFR